eukprot:NODE_106_length_19060_cov_0.700227.p14 type:complete len:193 gc:universal NODE_106_length_19060_cov_0.700227:4708-4130(-)
MANPVKFSSVVACSSNYCIGKQNTLPWPHLKKDLQWLNKLTTSTVVETNKNAVIMGRLTWESLPFQPLKNRFNIIVSTKMTQEDVGNILDSYVVDSFDKALQKSLDLRAESTFCLGGAKLYEHAFNHPDCEYIFITKINYVVDGDAFLKPSSFLSYTKLSDQEFAKLVNYAETSSVIEKDVSYHFECWERRK